MNTKNIEFLQDGLKYLGFDTKLGLEMARNIQAGQAAFTLQANVKHFKDDMKATIHFRKSDTNDMYFLNKFEASLTKGDGTSRHQTFYINKNAGVTFKEAYNLLSGRSVNKDLVNKEGERYNAWIQLDFEQKTSGDNYKVKQFNSNYGFDLEHAIAKHPVKELLDTEQKEKLIRSLSKGNVQSVTFSKDGQEERIYIEANPQFKTVNLYDAQMKKVFQENTNTERLEVTKQPDSMEKQQKTAEQIKQPSTKNTQTLLPKKSVSHRKGRKVN